MEVDPSPTGFMGQDTTMTEVLLILWSPKHCRTDEAS